MPRDYEQEIERVEQLFAFLQGHLPEGYKYEESRIPRLTKEQAWTVIHFVQEMHWQIPDTIERCDVCGDLFHSECEGYYTEEGPPYHYCDPCSYDI